jgi:hypothetical protein
MQATVRSFDPVTGSGSVFLNDGRVLDFGRDAFAASGLLRLRPGQRVSLLLDADGVITGLGLSTLPLPGEGTFQV